MPWVLELKPLSMNRYPWLNSAVEGLGCTIAKIHCYARDLLFCSARDRLLIEAFSSSIAIAVFLRGMFVPADAIRVTICRN